VKEGSEGMTKLHEHDYDIKQNETELRAFQIFRKKKIFLFLFS